MRTFCKVIKIPQAPEDKDKKNFMAENEAVLEDSTTPLS
jgi:hypothetical protein